MQDINDEKSAHESREGRASRAGRPRIIAVDGPAGSGKSSVCARVCERLGWTYINTGFLYRAVALIACHEGADLSDEDALMAVAVRLERGVRWDPETRTLWYDGRDLTPDLGSVEAGNNASFVAKQPRVREQLLPLQRRLAELSPRGALVDGRDIGTVVFPDADLKVFMTASLDERARRRLDQLGRHPAGNSFDLDQIKRDIALRDEQDAERGTAPLRQATDAVLFDTSNMGVEAAIEAFIALLRARGLA